MQIVPIFDIQSYPVLSLNPEEVFNTELNT